MKTNEFVQKEKEIRIKRIIIFKMIIGNYQNLMLLDDCFFYPK